MNPERNNPSRGEERSSSGAATERVTEAAPQGKILRNEAGETRLVRYSAPAPIGWSELTGEETISDHVALLQDESRLDIVVMEFLGYPG